MIRVSYYQSNDKGYTKDWACKRVSYVLPKRTSTKYKDSIQLLKQHKVVQKQINNTEFKKAIDDVDEQISKVQEYRELKETDSISVDTMYILKREIRGDLNISPQDDVIYKAYSAKELRVSLNEIVQRFLG